MTDTQTPPRRRRIGLIVSVFFNVLLVALIVVGVIRAKHMRDDPMAVGGTLAPAAIVKSLPSSDRERVRAIVEAHRAKLDSLRERAVTLRLESVNALGAANYDQKKFEASLKAVREADSVFGDEVGATIADAVAALSAEERKALADRALRRARFLGHHRK